MPSGRKPKNAIFCLVGYDFHSYIEDITRWRKHTKLGHWKNKEMTSAISLLCENMENMSLVSRI